VAWYTVAVENILFEQIRNADLLDMPHASYCSEKEQQVLKFLLRVLHGKTKLSFGARRMVIVSSSPRSCNFTCSLSLHLTPFQSSEDNVLRLFPSDPHPLFK
jgi:hypothetical protein